MIFFKAYFSKIKKKNKIEFWCEITIVAIIIWENLDLCFGQKNTLGERRGSEFRRQIDNYNRVFKL